jgi:hypothetical protein
MSAKHFKASLRLLCTIALVFALVTAIVEILIHLT